MDERKRTFDAGVNEQSQEQGINEHPKRFRPGKLQFILNIVNIGKSLMICKSKIRGYSWF